MLFEEEQARFAVLHREAWEADIKEKQRMQKMISFKDELAAQIQSRRAGEFERLQVTVCSPFTVVRNMIVQDEPDRCSFLHLLASAPPLFYISPSTDGLFCSV